MINQAIAKIFNEMAELLEIKGAAAKATPFRKFNYQKAAKALDVLDKDISLVYKESGIAGIKKTLAVGDKMAKKIEEYLKKKKIKDYEKLKEETAIQQIVTHYFETKGLSLEELKRSAKKRKIVYSRFTKPAKQLLELAGSLEKAKETMTKVAEWANSRGLDYSIETVFKKWLEMDRLRPKDIVKKPFFRGDPMIWSEAKKKWYVISPEGEWLEFAGKEADMRMEDYKVDYDHGELKIIFIGTPEFGAIILEKLIKSGHKPFLVITETDKPVGRKQIITPPPVKILAEKYKIVVVQPKRIGNYKLEIQNLKPDLGIIAAYGQILPKDIISIPQYGFLNVHPSLLPRWRGASPIQYTILNGDEKTGVTIIRISERMDAGPILAQKEIEIRGKETFTSLHNKLADLGAELLIESLPKLLAGKLPPLVQDETKATYTKILKKSDGKIDWQKPAKETERQIRALNPWPGTYTIYNGQRLKILKAEELGGNLIIQEVQLEGKNPMSFEDFLRGHSDFKYGG